MSELYHGDCLQVIPHLGLFNMVFADPPDGIGYSYNEYDDKRKPDEYLSWLNTCILRFISISPIVWLSFNAKWTIDVGAMMKQVIADTGVEVLPCTQIFTFGTQQQSDLKNCHRPLWRIMRPGTPLFPDQAREPSWRLKNGDPRADPRGCVPGDVFDFPRVTGNNKQKRKWHTTQLHEDLVARCVKLSTLEGHRILDPFGGSGTTLRVCKKLNRHCTLIEFDKLYCQKLSEEHEIVAKSMSKLP